MPVAVMVLWDACAVWFLGSPPHHVLLRHRFEGAGEFQFEVENAGVLLVKASLAKGMWQRRRGLPPTQSPVFSSDSPAASSCSPTR
jgi:hypothetical protein